MLLLAGCEEPAGTSPAASPVADPRPNIVLIVADPQEANNLADDQRYAGILEKCRDPCGNGSWQPVIPG